ncbi:MAG: hypothetical protein HY914_03870 [Desulfomonile tiedjei]|nr:hypothetical protein [Desulfomonile tiedjei]
MDHTTTLDLEKIHQSQLLRHVVANKITLPMTVLGELSEGKSVDLVLIERAIRDLKAIIQFVEEGKEPEA